MNSYSKEQSLNIKAGTTEAAAILKRSTFARKKRTPIKDQHTNKIRNKAISVFNASIRKRDKGKPCISCGDFTELQAGHYYSAGHHTNLRFNTDNVHGQCKRCNYFLSGNLTEYRKNLIEKIGIKAVETLDLLSKIKSYTKYDRFYFIEIIEKYKNIK